MKKTENLLKVILLVVTVATLLMFATKAFATNSDFNDLSNLINTNTGATNNNTSTATNDNTAATTNNNTSAPTNNTSNTNALGNIPTLNTNTGTTTVDATSNKNSNQIARNHLGNEGIGDNLFGGIINSRIFGLIIVITAIVAIFTYKKLSDYRNI